MYEETINNGIKIKVRIINSSPFGRKYSLYFKNATGEVKHVNVNKRYYENFNIGDSITVFVHRNIDWYEIDPLLVN